MCILYMDLLTPLANIQRKDIQVKIGTRDHTYLPSIVIDRSALLSFTNILGIPIPFHQYLIGPFSAGPDAALFS